MKSLIALGCLVLASAAHSMTFNDCPREWSAQKCMYQVHNSTPVDTSYRVQMQKDINKAVEINKTGEASIKRNNGIDVAELTRAICQQTAIVDTRKRYGYIKSSSYSKIYGECLRLNGLSY